MGKGDEIPNFMSGGQKGRGGGGSQPDDLDQVLEALNALAQNQKQLGAANAITQQGMMFMFNLLLRSMEAPDHVKEAFAEGMQRILQGNDPQEVHDDLKRNLASPGIIQP